MDAFVHTDDKLIKRKFGRFPWGCRESLSVAGASTAVGYALQALVPTGVSAPRFPANAVIFAASIAVTIYVYRAGCDNPLARWLRSSAAAVGALFAFGLQLVIMGVVPQENHGGALGFGNVVGSWPFALAAIYFHLVLGTTVVRRCVPFRLTNLPFVLNHAGLWVALAAGILGSGDFRRMRMHLEEGEMQYMAVEGTRLVPLGFSIGLDDFAMKTYAPELSVVARSDGDEEREKSRVALRRISRGDKYEEQGYEVEILTYFADSRRVGEGFEASEADGSAPSAFVRATTGGVCVSGWVSCGSFVEPPSHLLLADSSLLVMLEPVPESFELHLNVSIRGESSPRKAVIKVNKPYKVEGCRIYPTGYDKLRGKHSLSSEVEIVCDPWLPVVYFGVFMMMAGAFCMIFRRFGII